MLFLIIISLLLVAGIDISSTFRDKLFKEGIVSLLLYGGAITFCLTLKIGSPPPTPLKGITGLVQPITQGVLAIFQ